MKSPIVVLALLAAPALAQEEPGYTAASRKDAERAMADFARCEVNSTAGRAAALAFGREVAGTPSTYAQRLIKSSCAPRGTQMRFRPELFRMALFPALYTREYSKSAPADLSAAPASDYAREFDGTPGAETLTLRTFGDCVVRRDSANSRAVVLSKLYKPEEATAFTALQPAMAGCVPQGQQLRFSRTVLRGAVGEALYKLTVATGAAKAA